MSAGIPVHRRHIDGVGDFLFRRLVPADHKNFGPAWLSLRRGEPMPASFDLCGTARIVIAALTVSAPSSWCIDDADLVTLARVFVALCAGEDEASRADLLATMPAAPTSESLLVIRQIRGIGEFVFRHAAAGETDQLLAEFYRQTADEDLPVDAEFLAWAAVVALSLTIFSPEGWSVETLDLSSHDDAVRLTQVFVEICIARLLEPTTATCQ